MKSLSALALALLIGLAAPALARPFAAGPHLGVVNPSLSLSSPVTSPLQAQIRQDYATQLQSEQRTLLQQNPSGVTPDELAIGQQLNGYTPR
jgi:hypothetical protein